MPHSDNRNRPAILEFLNDQRLAPQTVLDVGCGAGTNLEFYKPWWPESHWTGLEVFPGYVERFFLFDRYDSLIIGDVRLIDDFKYDLVIFGDILEHLPKDDAWTTLEKALSQATMVLVALPIVHYPQGAIAGNPFEEHVSDWKGEELENHPQCFAAIENETTGAYLFAGYDNEH